MGIEILLSLCCVRQKLNQREAMLFQELTVQHSNFQNSEKHVLLKLLIFD